MGAEAALRRDARVPADARRSRDRHDAPHLHGAGEPRLRERGRRDAQDARRARARAGDHGDVRQQPVEGGAASRRPHLPRARVARRRSRSHGALSRRSGSAAAASTTTSSGRSTSRCSSSSGAATRSRTPGRPFRSLLEERLRGPLGRRWKTGRPTSTRSSPRSGSRRRSRFAGPTRSRPTWRARCPRCGRGILYDDRALAEAEALVEGWTYDEVAELRTRAWQDGLRAAFRGGPLAEVAERMVAIADGGLERRARHRRRVRQGRARAPGAAAQAGRRGPLSGRRAPRRLRARARPHPGHDRSLDPHLATRERAAKPQSRQERRGGHRKGGRAEEFLVLPNSEQRAPERTASLVRRGRAASGTPEHLPISTTFLAIPLGFAALPLRLHARRAHGRDEGADLGGVLHAGGALDAARDVDAPGAHRLDRARHVLGREAPGQNEPPPRPRDRPRATSRTRGPFRRAPRRPSRRPGRSRPASRAARSHVVRAWRRGPPCRRGAGAPPRRRRVSSPWSCRHPTPVASRSARIAATVIPATTPTTSAARPDRSHDGRRAVSASTRADARRHEVHPERVGARLDAGHAPARPTSRRRS